jgi:hypothetical protein
MQVAVRGTWAALHRTCKEAVKPSIFNLIQERLWWEIPWFVPVDLKYASIGRSYAIDEAAITMKTILVPIEDVNAIGSALETALILARRCDSYIEGFALRWEIAKFTEADHREIVRKEVQARATFESFMRKRGVPRSTTTTDSLSFG